MDGEYPPTGVRQVSKSIEPSQGDVDDDSAAGGTEGRSRPVTPSMSLEANEKIETASDTKAEKPSVAGLEVNQQVPELDNKKAQEKTNELGLKKNEFLTLPTLVISRICLFHSPLDIINFAMCHSKFEDTCRYELRMRKLRLSYICLRADVKNKHYLYIDVIYPESGVMTSGVSIPAQCEMSAYDDVDVETNTTIILFNDNYEGNYRTSSLKRTVVDPMVSTDLLAGMIYHLVTCCDVSKLEMCVRGRLPDDQISSERIDVALETYFGKDEYAQNEKIVMEYLMITPGTVSCLRWFAPRGLHYECGDRQFWNLDGLLGLLAGSVEKFWVQGPSSNIVSVDQIMENCRVPSISLIGNTYWSEDSFRRVLTKHAVGSDSSRTIESWPPEMPDSWAKMFSNWEASVGPDVAVRNGEARVTIEISKYHKLVTLR